MPTVTLLGSSATVAGRDNDNIYLHLEATSGDMLIDCGGSPAYKMAQVGADLSRLHQVLLTHDHTDHLYGLPLLVQTLMLLSGAGRWQGELAVRGLSQTLETARILLEALDMTGRIPLRFHPIPNKAGQLVLKTEALRIITAPVQHSRPTLGVRVEGKESGRVLVYSSDTEPCDAVMELAAGADVLLHEATVMEPFPGHSTPAQAGMMAAAAEAKQLVLVHFDPRQSHQRMIAEASKPFGGLVLLGRDFMQFEL